jgi:hypothetical protein
MQRPLAQPIEEMRASLAIQEAVGSATARLTILRLAVHDPLLLKIESEACEAVVRVAVDDVGNAHSALVAATSEECNAKYEAAQFNENAMPRGIVSMAQSGLGSAADAAAADEAMALRAVSTLLEAAAERVKEMTFIIEADHQAELSQLKTSLMDLRVRVEVSAALLDTSTCRLTVFSSAIR